MKGEKTLLHSPRHGWKDDSKANVKGIVRDALDWIDMIHDREEHLTFVSMVMNPRAT
jgi:hypothetical protein